MRLTKLNLGNYKSFRSSGPLAFAPGFNVVIGKNNSGKTALLEAFNLADLPHRPHRSLAQAPGMPLELLPSVEFELELTREELHHSMLALKDVQEIPVKSDDNLALQRELATRICSADSLALKLKIRSGGLESSKYPSHGMFVPNNTLVHMQVEAIREPPYIKTISAFSGANDSLPQVARHACQGSIYVFKAERLNIGRVRAAEATVLTNNGSNLAAVLGTLQANHIRFDRFNEHIREIFPTIRRVSVFTVGEEFEIRIWSVDPQTERQDLAIPLHESGTGVGQVLAILYVAMSVRNGIIVIDEPNSFLHPGAAKKLIQILRRYDQHQYVLATHSAELIATAHPEIVHLVSWEQGESKVVQINSRNVDDLRSVLIEIGVSFSDLFGYDRAVWVEGPTEEICFPIILDQLLNKTELGLVFVAVRATGDFEQKRLRKKLIWEIYEKLSSGALLLPAAVSFSFDREGRSESDLDDLKRQSKGRAHFLSRLTYENYLIDADALTALLNSLPRNGRDPVTSAEVTDWLNANGSKFKSAAKWNGDSTDPNWLAAVHAPSLLNEVLTDLGSPGDPIDKTLHSKFLTEWLIEHKPDAMAELGAHVNKLAEVTR